MHTKAHDGPASRTRSRLANANTTPLVAPGSNMRRTNKPSMVTKVKKPVALTTRFTTLADRVRYFNNPANHLFNAEQLEGIVKLRLTNKEENHRGYQFHYGLNVDRSPFNDWDQNSCTPGLYFFAGDQIDVRHISGHLNMESGPLYWVRSVSLPPGAKVVRVHGSKMRAHCLILGERQRYDWTKHPHYMALPLWLIPHDMQTAELIDHKFNESISAQQLENRCSLELQYTNPQHLTPDLCKNIVWNVCRGRLREQQEALLASTTLFEAAYRRYGGKGFFETYTDAHINNYPFFRQGAASLPVSHQEIVKIVDEEVAAAERIDV